MQTLIIKNTSIISALIKSLIVPFFTNACVADEMKGEKLTQIIFIIHGTS